MSKYLVVKCKELGDQYECDADRTPMFMCDSWEDLELNYAFEVWEFMNNGQFERIKDYDEPPTKGSIVLAYFPDGFDPDYIILTQTNIFFASTSHAMPKEVAELFKIKLEENGVGDDEIQEDYYNDYDWSYCVVGEFGVYVYGTFVNGRLSTPW